MLGSMSALGWVRGNAGTIAFFTVAFVVAPLVMVAWKGGGRLESRYQQWNALRQSIQSADPAREAIDDPVADTALIESFLIPAPDRQAQARAYYEDWRGNRHWWTMGIELVSVEYDETEGSATVIHELLMRVVRESVETERQKRARIETWEKEAGIWYLQISEDRLLEDLPIPSAKFIEP